MLIINFLPDSNFEDVSASVREYEDLWKSDGVRIVDAWESLSGYTFKETFINAVICPSQRAQSHPLSFKAEYTAEEKKLYVTHELGHRILRTHLKLAFTKRSIELNSLENHKVFDLLLYDVFELVYGKAFTDYAVVYEREQVGGVYKEAWDFALSFKTKEERQQKFKEMMM